MILLVVHVVGASLWFGTAATLPFWGRRMNHADNLEMALGIGDTVFLLKNCFIMGGLVATLGSGALLSRQFGLPFFDFGAFFWLGVSQVLALVIAFNSITILVLMLLGRRGLRHFYRYIPPIGYNNLALIALVYLQMTLKPLPELQARYLALPLAVIALADISYIVYRVRRRLVLMALTPEQFAQRYFGFMNAEDFYGLFGLFRDDATISDPFASDVVRGAKEMERFFQFLGDQFETIKMHPVRVQGTPDAMTIHWRAHGITKNGLPMLELLGTNLMRRKHGKIQSMEIEFDLDQLPQVELYRRRPTNPVVLVSPAPLTEASQQSTRS